ncbi:MAG: RICIN domain-containing protein [Microbacteriaceae bacterium]|nr:RICIN domain-containing protein [Microbacteriaceae bacterium]
MTTDRDAERASIWKRLRLSRVGVTIALVAFLVLGGTGAFAYWGVTASLGTSASTGTLAVTTSWSSSLGATLTNSSYTKTGEFTVTNTTSTTSMATMPYTAMLSYSGGTPGPLASNLILTVWKKSGNCTAVGFPSYTGTWGTPPALGGSLVKGTSDIWCIRTAVDERSSLASPTGTVTITPRVSATLTMGTYWTRTSTTVNDAVQKTSYIYPAPVPLPSSTLWYRLKTSVAGSDCADVRGSGRAGQSPAQNTDVLAYACRGTQSANQQVKFTPTDTGYVTISYRHDPTAKIGVAGNSTAVGAKLQTQVAVTGEYSQQWQFQQKSPGIYQIVNRRSGLCIAPDTAMATPYEIKQVACSGATLQEFTLTAWENAPLSGDICENTGEDSERTIYLEFDPTLQDDVTIQVAENATGPWYTVGTAGYDATSFVVSRSYVVDTLGWDKDTYYYQVVGSLGTQLNTDTFKVKKKSGYLYLKCN